MAAPRRLCPSVVGETRNRLLRDDSIESCLTEQRCSLDLPCLTFCFVLLLVRLSLESLWLLTFDCAFGIK